MDTRQTSQATATARRPGSSWRWPAWLAGIRGTCVRPLCPETRRRPGSTQIPARSQENRIPTLSGQRGGSGAVGTPCAPACVSLGKPAAAAAPGWKRPARGGRHRPPSLAYLTDTLCLTPSCRSPVQGRRLPQSSLNSKISVLTLSDMLPTTPSLGLIPVTTQGAHQGPSCLLHPSPLEALLLIRDHNGLQGAPT